MLLAGLVAVILTEIYSAVLQREFQHTENRVGKGFAILGVYAFAVCYCMPAVPLVFHFLSTNRGCFRWPDQLGYMVIWL